MKPKTKKTIIIVAAVVAVAAIVYFAFFRKKASSIIDKLGLTSDQAASMKAKVAEIEANSLGLSGWTKEEIKRKAAEQGYTYNQWLVVEAAYALYYDTDWTLYNSIAQMAKNL